MLIMLIIYNCMDFEVVNKVYYVVVKLYYVDRDQVYYICYVDYFMNGSFIFMCDGVMGNWMGNYFKCSLIIIIVIIMIIIQFLDGNFEF